MHLIICITELLREYDLQKLCAALAPLWNKKIMSLNQTCQTDHLLKLHAHLEAHTQVTSVNNISLKHGYSVMNIVVYMFHVGK